MQIPCHGSIFFNKGQGSDGEDFCFWPVNGENGHLKHLGVFVQHATVMLEVPDDFDGRKAQVEILQRTLTKARAEFQNLQTRLLRQISELTAIEGPVVAIQYGDDIPF